MKSSSFFVLIFGMLMFVTSAFGSETEAEQESGVDSGPSSADWLEFIRQQNRFNKRAQPSDPRNLFAAIYGNYASNMG